MIALLLCCSMTTAKLNTLPQMFSSTSNLWPAQLTELASQLLNESYGACFVVIFT